MPNVQDTIAIARVCTYLMDIDTAKKNIFQRGSLSRSNYILVYLIRETLESIYNIDQNYAGLQQVANYLYWLCDKYTGKAKAILALGNTGLLSSVTTTVGDLSASIKGFRTEILVGAGQQIVPGQTSYTINYANIIEGTVDVRLPQSNVPEAETNQFSWTVHYGKNNTIVNFSNSDGSGNNLGAQDGMLLILSGLRLVTADPSSIDATTSLKLITINGSQIVSGSYDNAALAGYDVLVDYNGVGYIDVVSKPTGGFTLIGPYAGVTFTSADKFIIIPTEIGFSSDTIIGQSTYHSIEFVIGDIGAPMSVGDTTLAIIANNIQTTPFRVIVDGSPLVKNRTDRFSYTVAITPTAATITFNSRATDKQSFIIEYNTLS